MQLGEVEGLGERLVGEPECRRRVGAPAPEAGRDRNPLREAHRPTQLDAGSRGEQLERGADERVVYEAVDLEAWRGLERDAVAQVDPLVDRAELVLAVLPSGTDDEGEVQLRRRGRASHESSSASAAKSSGASRSARVAGEKPSCSSAAAARSRSAWPASSSEFGSVFRRCAKAASTRRFTAG